MHEEDGTIRRAVPGEEELLRSLRIAALTDAPDAFGSTLERERARTDENLRGWTTGGAVFLLERDGLARGIVAGLPATEDERGVYLVSMWVHPEHRGGGRAAALVDAVRAWAAERGAAYVLLHVGRHNARARRLYERCGFRATGREMPGTRAGVVEVEMRLEL
jgi:ribosomal protein S18 acetylase RimI-like enzyme